MNAYARWAYLVAQAVSAPHELRTLPLWARHVGASVSTISARCSVVDVTAVGSRDLGRLLRVVVLSNSTGVSWEPAADLETRDPRTLRQLLARAGLVDWPLRADPPSVDRFLAGQRFVHIGAVPSLRRAIRAQMARESEERGFRNDESCTHFSAT